MSLRARSGVARGFEVVEQRALGDLEAERGRVDRVVAHRAGDELGEVGPLQLPGRDVGRHRRAVHRQGRRLRRSRSELAGPVEHPLADRHDDAGLLGDAQEVAAAAPARARVLPAQERLDRRPARRSARSNWGWNSTRSSSWSRARRSARSVRSRETACVCIASSNSSWRAPPRRLARYIAASASCSRFDGALRRPVGDRDPDARRHRHLGAGEHERLGERRGRALGELDGLLLAAEVLAQHDELVAAEAGDGVLAAHGAVEPAAHRDRAARRRSRGRGRRSRA